MTPEVRNIIKAHLREWAKYHLFVANNPGNGYGHVNTLKRIMKPNAGDGVETVAARDWTPEERTAGAMAWLLALGDADQYYALGVEGYYHGLPQRRRVSAWNQLLLESVDGWEPKGRQTYVRTVENGYCYLRGTLLNFLSTA